MLDLTDEQIKVTQKTFDKNALEYSVYVERDPKVVKSTYINVIKPFLNLYSKNYKNKKIAILGCGTGRDTERLSKIGFITCNYDKSQKMIEIATRLLPKNTFTLFDITKDRLPINEFDGVFADSVLNYIKREDLQHTLQNISKSMKDDGYAMFSFKVNAKEYVFKDNVFKSPRYYNIFVDKTIKNILQKECFKIVNNTVNDDNLGRHTAWSNYFLQKTCS